MKLLHDNIDTYKKLEYSKNYLKKSRIHFPYITKMARIYCIMKI